MMQEKQNKNSGFTLVELIVVLAVLAILASYAIPALLGYIDKGRSKQCQANMESLMSSYQTALTQKNVEGASYSLTNYVADTNPTCPSSKEKYTASGNTLRCPKHGAVNASGGTTKVVVNDPTVSQPAKVTATPTETSEPTADPTDTSTPTPTATAIPTDTPIPTDTAIPTATPDPTVVNKNGKLPIYNVGFDYSTLEDMAEYYYNNKSADSKVKFYLNAYEPPIIIYNGQAYVISDSNESFEVDVSDTKETIYKNLVAFLKDNPNRFISMGYIKDGDLSGLYTKDGTRRLVYNADLLNLDITDAPYTGFTKTSKLNEGQIILYKGIYYVCRKNGKNTGYLTKAVDNNDTKTLNNEYVKIGTVNSSDYSETISGTVKDSRGRTYAVKALDLDNLSNDNESSGVWNQTTVKQGQVISYTKTGGSNKLYVYVGQNDFSIYGFDTSKTYNKSGIDNMISNKGTFVEFKEYTTLTREIIGKNIDAETFLKVNDNYYYVLKGGRYTVDDVNDTSKFLKVSA